ncbi:NADP-dependent oxidoreductase domain-containing protein [Mucidula mucida]|nr:NADP-dependent oxidoreductase domain-containing protein [Mucidula mucida]
MSFADTTTTVTLNTGAKMPIVAMGSGIVSFDPADQFAAREWLFDALKAGYRHIDTAAVYDEFVTFLSKHGTEASVGVAVRKSGIPRHEVFVTTKLPFTGFTRVKQSFEHSLKELDLEYIDLYLIHNPTPVVYEEGNPFPTNPDGTTRLDNSVNFIDVWAEMEALLETGKVKAIGVSNFSPKTLDELLKTAKVVPAVNQVEVHPYLVQEELRQYCKDKGIVITAYTASGRDAVRNDPKIVALAAKYNVTPTQLVLGWQLTRGVPIITQSTNAGRQKENLKLPVIAAEDVTQINALDCGERVISKLFMVNGTLFGWTYEQYGW